MVDLNRQYVVTIENKTGAERLEYVSSPDKKSARTAAIGLLRTGETIKSVERVQ